MFSWNTTVTRNLILSRLTMCDAAVGTRDIIEAKLRCEMLAIYERNECIVNLIVDELQDQEINLTEGVSFLLEAICRRVCWYTIVCLCVVLETLAKRMYNEMALSECLQVAELVAQKTSAWTEEHWWMEGFMNKFQSNNVMFEKRIFEEFINIID
jgi:hypothetical protein